jgi:hypothetical protein
MQISRWDIILGFTTNGKEVTLMNNYSRESMSFPGMRTSKVYPDVVFVGSYFNSKDEILFEAMSIRYKHLDEWANISGFNIKYNRKEKETSIKYKHPDSIRAQIYPDLAISIRFNAKIPLGATTKLKIEQNSEFHIVSTEPRDFDFYQGLNRKLHNFLSLAVLKNLYPIYLVGKTKDKKVEIYYKNIFTTAKEEKNLTRFDILFPLRPIETNLKYYLRRWIEKSDRFKPVHDLYFGSVHSPKMYLEFRLLSYCQAIEAYHRRLSKCEYQDRGDFLENVYPKLIDAIPGGIDKDHRTSMKGRLRYLNEYSLRKRLNRIYKTHEKSIIKLIPNKSKFIGSLVDTRNFFTHYDDSLKCNSASGEELYLLIERIKFVIEVCFLNDIGFYAHQINSLIAKTHKYDYLKSKKDV